MASFRVSRRPVGERLLLPRVTRRLPGCQTLPPARFGELAEHAFALSLGGRGVGVRGSDSLGNSERGAVVRLARRASPLGPACSSKRSCPLKLDYSQPVQLYPSEALRPASARDLDEVLVADARAGLTPRDMV